jgi:hypothetical protein
VTPPDRDWDKELSKIDKQLETVSDAQLFPQKPDARPSEIKRIEVQRETTNTWPALLRLALSVALGVGILFWPYGNRCGLGLGGYLVAVTAVAASGVWSSLWTWRHRTGRAHVLSVLLIVWGLILGTMEILPRAGYAKQSLPWSCSLTK